MKSFLYKYAEYIFWGLIALNALNLLTGNLFVGAVSTIWLIIPYFIFKNAAKDRWFLTYFLGFVLSGISYFVYVAYSNNLPPLIFSAFILGIGSFIIYKTVYKLKGNKLMSWVTYILLSILSYFAPGFFNL